MIAPGAAERHSGGWLDRAVTLAGERLASEGVAALVLPRRSRVAALRRLRARGLVTVDWIAGLRTSGRGRVLLPLEPEAVRYALRALTLARRARIDGSVAALRLPGGPGLGALLPAALALVRRDGGPPLAAWLGGDGPVVVTSRLGEGAGAVVHGGLGPDGPARVARIADGGGPAALGGREQVTAAAALAGARVPALLEVRQLGPAVATIESGLRGTTAARLLAERPERLGAVLAGVARWLERWAVASRAEARLEADELDRRLLTPARTLADSLPAGLGAAYASRLASLCDEAAGRDVPLCAAHGDLTMWNVLVDGEGIGVVDWEEARDAALPLGDLLYAAADACAAVGRYRDRVGAFRDSQALVRPYERRLADALGLDERLVELCRHACWLGHAANEARRARPGDPRPFLGIVAELAAAGRR